MNHRKRVNVYTAAFNAIIFNSSLSLSLLSNENCEAYSRNNNNKMRLTLLTPSNNKQPAKLTMMTLDLKNKL